MHKKLLGFGVALALVGSTTLAQAADECVNDGECDEGEVCSGGECGARMPGTDLPAGADCTSDDECASGKCTSAMICDIVEEGTGQTEEKDDDEAGGCSVAGGARSGGPAGGLVVGLALLGLAVAARRRKGLAATLVVGALLLMPGVARADWQSGPWTGRPLVKDGKFLGCVMETAFSPDGRRFKFLQLRNFELLIGLGKRRPYPSGRQLMLMEIDGNIVREATGSVRPAYPNSIWINLGLDRGARDKLKSGNQLVLTRSGGKRAVRSLEGTFAALNRLEVCVGNGS